MLNKSFTILFFTILLLSGVSSCKKDPSAAPDLGYNYFPDKVGTYVIYNVDSFSYDGSYYPAKIDTTRYQLKEKIESVFTDNEGRPTLRLERYVKKYNSAISYGAMSWHLRNVWVENKSLRNAEKVEDNVRYVKLAFPVKEDQLWNGNAQNVNAEEDYKYAFFDQPRTLGNIHFDSVLQVAQHDESSLVDQVYYEEKYARNTGMIYKRVINVQSQYPTSWNSNPHLSDSLTLFYHKPILSRVSSGYQYTMTISAFGTE